MVRICFVNTACSWWNYDSNEWDRPDSFILAVIRLFGWIYFAVWFLCALQRNQREDIHSLEETRVLHESHNKFDEDFDEGQQLILDEVVG